MLGVAGAAGAVALAFVVGADPGGPVDPPVARTAVGPALTLVGLVLELVGLVRGGVLRSQRQSPLWAVPARERRRLRRQVKGRAPVVPEDLPALRALAGSVRDQRWLLPVWGGLGLVQLGQAVQHGGALALFFATGALVLVVCAVLVHRDVRRAERFLAEHARSTGAEGGGAAPGRDAPPERPGR